MPPAICLAPWLSLHYSYNAYGPCCAFPIPGSTDFPLSEETCMKLFNSKEMMEIRTRLLKHDIIGLPCQGCYAIGKYYKKVVHHFEEPSHIKERVLNSIDEQEVCLNYPPARFEIGGLQDCNLNCKMCGLSRGKFPRISKDKTADHFFSLTQSIGWENIAEISLASGEPLFNPTTSRIISFFAQKTDIPTVLKFSTNGTLIHKHAKTLNKIGKLSIHVGVDAWGKRYEEIRRGAKWTKIKENIEQLSQIKAGHPQWYADIHSIIMKTSLPDIQKLIDLASKLGFDYSAHPIEGNHLDENIFAFPHLLQNSDWENDLDKAIASAESPFPKTALDLKKFKSVLGKVLNGEYIKMRAGMSPKHIGRVGSFFQKYKDKCVVLGLTRQLFDYLNTIDRPDNILAIAEFGVEKGKCFTYDLIPPELIMSYSNNIVIAEPSWDYGRYTNAVNQLHSEANIIHLPFWFEETENQIDEIVQKFNKKPIAFFCTGGCAESLIKQTNLNKMNFVCFSDNDASKWGSTFFSKPIVSPDVLPDFTEDVLILSECYTHDIKTQLTQLFGEKINIYGIF